jgi:outer membrane protein assembly factor BamB
VASERFDPESPEHDRPESDHSGRDRPEWAELDQPVLDILPLTDDVVPLSGARVVSGSSVEHRAPTARPRPVRSVVGSTLTVLGLVGTVVAAALPWSGSGGLPAVRGLAGGQSWLVWLLLAVVAAVVLGVIGLVRPRRGVLWAGVVLALVGAVLSAVAVVALPTDRPVGVGPGLAAVALLVLTVGQAVSVLAGPAPRPLRWQPSAIAAAVAVVVLVAAGFGSAGLVNARDVDATTATGPPPAITGTFPSTVDRMLWHRTVIVYDVSGDAVLAAGHATRGDTTLTGVAVLDVRTGAERWHHYERGWTVREATITDSTALLVVDSATGTMAVDFDIATGAQRWRERLAASVDCTSPGQDQIAPIGACAGQFVTGDGLLFTVQAPANGPAPVTYLVAGTGEQWQVALGTGCRVRGTGTDAQGVYVLEQCVSAGFPQAHLLSEQVVAYDLTGHVRWTVPLAVVKGTVAGGIGPVFVQADVVLAQQEQRWVVLDTRTGGLLWTSTDSFEPATVVNDGTTLAWSTGVQLVALDLHTGAQLWEQDWSFPEEADLPVIANGRLHVVRHTVGPNPYTCAEHATLLSLDPSTGRQTDPPSTLPDGAGNDCGPDVQDRSFVAGPLLVLVTANQISVVGGH